jgi:hypothetical protein
MKTATYYRVKQNKANGGHVISWFKKEAQAAKWVAENPGCEAPVAVPVAVYRGGFSPIQSTGIFGRGA